MNISALVYSGMRIRNRDEMLCLTDMWRAAGGDDPSKRPAEWLRQEGPQEFIRYIADDLDMGITHIAFAEKGGREGGGATWAHWQVGLAYAKYLSPEFHAWCNEVVRSHMELTHKGRDLPAVEVFGKLFDTKLDPIHKKLDRTHDVTKSTADNVVHLIQRVDDRIPRKDPPEKNKRLYQLTIAKRLDGYCPCGCRQKLIDEKGNILRDQNDQPLAVIDHWYSRERNGLDACWLVQRDCNQKLRDDDYRRSKHSRFVVFHEERKAVQGDVSCVPNKKSRARRRRSRCKDPDQLRLL
jgi:hypothetical protein